MKITIIGAAGRMGKTLCELIEAANDISLVAAIEHSESAALGQEAAFGSNVLLSTDLTKAAKESDLVIDFALANNIAKRIDICAAAKTALLIGTTGIDEEGYAAIEVASQSIAILPASNMSLGVNLVFELAAQAAKTLGIDFKISIDETHHIHKLDAPSGTALSIGQAVENAVGPVEIDYDSYREGEVIGDHCIRFESEDEIIEIAHHAKERSLFAKGALHLAKLLVKKEPGLYEVKDLIF